MKKLLLMLLMYLSFLPSLCFGDNTLQILCCGDTYRVQYQSDFEGTTTIWCQRSQNGKLFKEGNFKVLNAQGEIIAKKIFKEDREIANNREILTCDESKSTEATANSQQTPGQSMTNKAETTSVTSPAATGKMPATSPLPSGETIGARQATKPHTPTFECPSPQVESKLKEILSWYNQEIISFLTNPFECTEQPKGHKLLIEREMVYSKVSIEEAAKRRPCLKTALTINHYQELTHINNSAQVYCYLAVRDPKKLAIKPKSENFRYNFFVQNSSNEQRMEIQNSTAINRSLAEISHKYNAATKDYNSELVKIFGVAKKEVSSFLDSTEGLPLKEKIRSYDNQIRQLLY